VKRVTLVTGGARCGKSRYALSLLEPYRRKAFIATAEALDEEMRDRIAAHQAERGPGFVTVEAPIELAEAVRRLPGDIEAGVVDCLTVWLGNLLHVFGEDDDATGARLEALVEVLHAPPADLVVVTNEVGWGIVPENPLARRFRDLAGRLNQQAAAMAHEVVLMVSGLPLHLKRSLP
jgi:adenosylcobinamide kinase/adenosylcobinamide-phosphate guanylyltransferase